MDAELIFAEDKIKGMCYFLIMSICSELRMYSNKWGIRDYTPYASQCN